MESPPSSEIPREVVDIMTELDLIAGIPPGHKYNTKTKTYVNAASWWSTYTRTRGDEDFEGTINYINKQIDESINIARNFPAWKKIIKEKVSNIRNALINLKHTYSNTAKAFLITRLDVIHLRIDPQAFETACSKEVIKKSNPLAIPRKPETDLEKLPVGSVEMYNTPQSKDLEKRRSHSKEEEDDDEN